MYLEIKDVKKAYPKARYKMEEGQGHMTYLKK